MEDLRIKGGKHLHNIKKSLYSGNLFVLYT